MTTTKTRNQTNQTMKTLIKHKTKTEPMTMKKAIDFICNGDPWAITEDALQTIITIANREHDLQAVLLQRGQPLKNDWKAERHGNVAIVPITGPIIPRADLFSEISGATSIETLASALGEIEKDSLIKSIILNIDSPGGNVTGVNELGKIIAGFSKPVYAYVNGTAASAAYWLAASAQQIIIDDTARLGSIGVVAAYRKNDDKNSIEIVSSNAPDKRPDLNTEQGVALVRNNINALESVFIAHVAAQRNMPDENIKALRGGIVVGAQAIEKGLADRIGTLESLILTLNEENHMDLSKLKAEHPDVYQAALNESAVNAQTAVSTERQRISTILTCEHAIGREAVAQTLALETDLTAEQAAKILAVAPVTTASTQTDRPDNQFVKMMDKLGNPAVGADTDKDAQQEAMNQQAISSLWDKALSSSKIN